MKVRLMHRDRDFDLAQALPANAQGVTQDLELDTLVRAMAGEDAFLDRVARTALLSGLRNDIDTVLYRQAILRDCLNYPGVARTLYAIAVEAIERKRNQWWAFSSHYARATLYSSVELLQIFLEMFHKLRAVADDYAGRLESDGLKTLLALLKTELSDAYLAQVDRYLKELAFRKGVLMSARVGGGNQGTGYVLRKAPEKSWLERILGDNAPSYTFSIDPRDEQGGQLLSQLRDRGIDSVANALAQSADHIIGFFDALRLELAFYVGCLNAHDRLAAKGEPVCFPHPVPAGERRHQFAGLYDVCLSLQYAERVVGNTVDADHKPLVVITGANTGGKSTFLRSIGLAQLMMQCGMFVGAEEYTGAMCPALFTHYKRQEDATMEKGKLDEELARASDIVDHLVPDALVLFNESFAATNEREGSEIATQIVSAFLEERVRVFFVTHLYEFAHRLFARHADDSLFLRAERRSDGKRTFRLVVGEPLQTSYGEDLYRQIFETPAPHAVPASGA